MSTGDFEPQSGQSGETEPYAPPPAAGGEPGGLGLRLGARIIDGVIVGVVAFLLSLMLNTLNNYWVNGLFTGVLTFIYFVALEVSQGWTPGKKLLGLSVHGAAGTPKPTLQQSATRNVWTLFSIVPFVGGILSLIAIIWIAVTINSSPTKQGIHDKLAGGTQVVKD